MNRPPPLLFLVFLLFCTAIFAQDERKMVPITDLSQLEGRYNAIAVQDTVETTLDWISMIESRLDYRYLRDRKCQIVIQKTRRNRLSFSLWEGEKKLAASHMKGRLKDGMVNVKRTKLRIFLVVLNVITVHRATMAITENGDLVVSDAKLGGCPLIVFLPFFCAGDYPPALVFERMAKE